MASFVKATKDLIASEGMDAISIRRVSAAAGYSSATLYLYFDDINELVTMSLISSLEAYIRDIIETTPDDETPRAEYLRTWQISCRHAFADPATYLDLFYGPRSRDLDVIAQKYYELFPEDLLVKAYYSNGTSKQITDGFAITQNGTSGNVTLYVTYKGVKSNTIAYTFSAPAVTGVAISAKASEYEAGYQLTYSDLNVIATYEDGSTKPIEGQYLYIIYQEGNSLYINYKGAVSNTITINYKEATITLSSVSVAAQSVEYEDGYLLTKDDLTVKAIYSDGTEEYVSDYIITQTRNSLYVTYKGVNSNTISFIYVAPVVTVTSVSIELLETEYGEGYLIDTCDLIVTVAYSDRTSGVVTDYTWNDITQENNTVYVTYNGVKSNVVTFTTKDPGVVTVPFVLGKDFAVAKAELEALGLVVVNDGEEYSDTIAVGAVSQQSLRSGAVVTVGSTILLNVSKGPAQTVTVTSVIASLNKSSYIVNDVITVDNFTVNATYSDGSTNTVTTGLSLIDHTLGHTSGVVSSITLDEYEGDVYKKNSYKASISYEGVESNQVNIPWNYENGVWLCDDMLTLVNNARTAEGLTALHWDSVAESVILTRAQELAISYSHTRPSGASKEDMYGNFWGENISMGTYQSSGAVERTFEAWMNSAGHKACIMDDTGFATGFVCARCIATDSTGEQICYWVMWITMN